LFSGECIVKMVIAGGGTGGHVIPALAIARELRERHAAEVLFIGTARGIENRLVPAAGYPLELVEVGKLKNVGVATRAKTLFDLPRAVAASRKILRGFGAQVVIGVGGYASGPAMLAAQLMGIPTVAFEPNVVPGLANRLVARKVKAAAVHFEETAKFFRNAKVTGVPVRQEFFSIPAKAANQPTTLLVFGGSQGAQAINQAVTGAFPILKKAMPGLRIVHQTGEKSLAEVRAAYQGCGLEAQVSAFIQDMPKAFAEADLLVCRSGASTVAEVTAAGKPAVFVPFPQAADDHQLRNAEALAKAGAARLIPQSELTPERLAKELLDLLQKPDELAIMAAAARQLAHPGAAREIADMAAALVR
jgi:UDP-N-acetylglucosamine--N-acetylmuramyl-(pentapeptide) pyrophosphoryl-undecaprenol N-acetylglucosamine transferase